MGKQLVKVYIYTRVSTVMQVDGYSLDAQKDRIHAFCEYNGYSIAGEYEDAGRSGKSIEGRPEFNRMMNDIKAKDDKVSFVLVYKLSRFGRNAADVLSSLQIMQDYGVNLICVEDGIDSSKDAGKLMISVLSAVAEIERENIRVQTMEGRMQKAREGKWNGGFAPYGYSLVKGELVINEDEATAIRTIFDLYVHTDMGSTAIEKYLDQHDIRKIPRQNGKNELFTADFIRKILANPVYAGKIAFGRRRTEKKKDLNARLYRMYDKIDEYENLIQDAALRKAAIFEKRISAENIYKILCNFDSFLAMASGRERRDLLEALVKDVYINEEKTESGQWLRAIRFRLPIIKEDMVISLDNKEGTEMRPYLRTQNSRRQARRQTRRPEAKAAVDTCKSLVQIDLHEFDKNEFLLNTPSWTYDLRKGLSGKMCHRPGDFITKSTSVDPGDEGKGTLARCPGQNLSGRPGTDQLCSAGRRPRRNREGVR